MATGWKDGLRQGKDGLWHFRFKLGDSIHEGSTGCAKHKDAKTWRDAYRTNLSKQAVGLRVVPTFGAAYQDWVETKTGKRSEAHINRARRALELHVIPRIGETRADLVTTADIEGILSTYLAGTTDRVSERHLHRKRSPHGANTVLLYIRMIYGHLEASGIKDCRYWEVEKVSTQEPVRVTVPLGDAAKFFDAVNKTRNLHQMLGVRAQFWMGLRESAAVQMRWEWFSGDLRQYTTGRAKNGKAKVKPVDEGIRILLWALLWLEHEGKRPFTGFVMLAEDGLPHRQQFTKKAIQRGAAALRMVGLTPHRMRASLATNLARAGQGAHMIKEMLDHKSIETSEKYVRLGTQDLEDALAGLKEKVTQA